MAHLRPAADPRDAEPLLGMRRSLRAARVAAILDIDPRRVRDLVKNGELEGHRQGKRGIRVYEDSVDAYRRRQHVGPRDPEPKPRPQRRPTTTAAAHEAMAALKDFGVFE